MLDQSFSAENFRKIFDIENRKGVYLEGEFYADIDEINKKIKELNSGIRTLKTKGLSKEDLPLKDHCLGWDTLLPLAHLSRLLPGHPAASYSFYLCTRLHPILLAIPVLHLLNP